MEKRIGTIEIGKEWKDIKKEQPREGDIILGKVLSGTKTIKVTITGDIWDYGFNEWRYFDEVRFVYYELPKPDLDDYTKDSAWAYAEYNADLDKYKASKRSFEIKDIYRIDWWFRKVYIKIGDSVLIVYAYKG